MMVPFPKFQLREITVPPVEISVKFTPLKGTQPDAMLMLKSAVWALTVLQATPKMVASRNMISFGLMR